MLPLDHLSPLTHLAFELTSAYHLEGESTFRVIFCLLLLHLAGNKKMFFTTNTLFLQHVNIDHAFCMFWNGSTCIYISGLGIQGIRTSWGSLSSAQLELVDSELAGPILCPPANFSFSNNANIRLQTRLPAGCWRFSCCSFPLSHQERFWLILHMHQGNVLWQGTQLILWFLTRQCDSPFFLVGCD